MSTRKTVFLIGNAHLDPVWLWRWQEGCAEVRNTCRAAAGFIDEFPGFVFTRSSAGDMRWIEETEPGLFKTIQQHARAGHWSNAGGWWTQPDCTIPCGESFVRQGLYGQAFFKERLGHPSLFGYNVDSFGHNAGLPQILRKSGMPYYVFMRPAPYENRSVPEGYFRWRGIDGSEVLAFRVFSPYATWSVKQLKEQLDRLRAHMEKTGTDSIMLFYGVGNHGGGPTREQLNELERLRSDPEMPDLVYASCADAFARCEAEGRELPVFTGDLHHHASGCYAAQTEVKEMNRRCEEALLAAERTAAVCTALTGRAYPHARIEAAWHDLLFNQFHDILSGSSVREACRDTRDQLGRACFTAEEALNASVQALASRIDTRGTGTAFILFNPHPFDWDGLFETGDLHGSLRQGASGGDVVWHCDGTDATCVQNVQPSSSVECERFVVKAHVPALGWTVCRLKRRGPHARPRLPKGPAITAKTDTLDNGLLRVRVTTGGVHLRDLERARALTRTPGIRVLVIDDPSDTWGHDCYRFDRVKGSFALTSVRCIERGPLRAALRAEYRYRKSRLYLDILVEQGRKACELRARLLLLEKRVLVKVAVPVNARSKAAWHEIPYGAIERTNSGEEMPVQQWLDLSDGTLGLSLVNNGRYAVSVEKNEMRQTIARSAPYAWQDYRACRREAGAAWTDDRWFHDQGFSECALLLIPHEGDWRKACTVHEARKFNRALSIVQEGMHSGGLAPCFGFIRCSSRDVLVSVVKRSEDGAGFVVRASEIAGRRCRARFSIPALRAGWQSAFGPWEIKTFRFAAERPGNVKEIDLTETGGG